MGVVSSCGMQTWELVTSLASIHDLPIKLVVPAPEIPSSVRRDCLSQFRLEDSSTEFLAPNSADGQERPDLRKSRDLKVIAESDLLIPVSIRESGSLSDILCSDSMARKRRVEGFQCRYDAESSSGVVCVEQSLNPEIHTLDDKYLFHWTRGTNAAWPDERKVDLYRDVMASTEWPRSGYDTLRRILESRRIIGSGKRVQGGGAVVSFSGLAPARVIPLMKWRARYHQMSFEPYAIGVKTELAHKLGILPVQYYDRTKTRPPDNEDQWQWQSAGQKTDWQQEDEYRHKSDFDFSRINPEDIRVICLNRTQAQGLRCNFPYPVTAMTT